MFETLFSGLKAENTNEQYSTRRRFSRRSCDNSAVVIDGQIYPVENWSMGGVAVNGDSRGFGVNTTVDVTMKFKLSNDVIDLPHTARVVRKSNDRIAFEFDPLSDTMRKGLQLVVDDYVSSKFAESQLAH
ncbi:MAG: PilZ domain-containing protein [Alphaproteobacteria bacterium]|nr:PilZ domain-containing protein [Alphaproteobacteria bacterium]